jgi:hypothetical protein
VVGNRGGDFREVGCVTEGTDGRVCSFDVHAVYERGEGHFLVFRRLFVTPLLMHFQQLVYLSLYGE